MLTPMKYLDKILASKTLLCSLSLFLMLTTSSLAQEIDRNVGGQGVNPTVDVSVHPEVTGQPTEQPSKSRTAAPASTFGATRVKPLSATTGSGIAPKAQAPLTQPFNPTYQGSSSDTQTNAATGVTRRPPTPQKHFAKSSASPAPASSATAHLGFAATQPHLGGLQSSVHHSSGKRSAHASSNKLFTSKHKSLDQGIPTESKSSAHHSPKSKLE
jgi:hypothetical protein